jgi:predicted nucleic acid-binding protein
MITAIDSSVLLDVLLDDPTYCAHSAEVLRAAHADGALIVCPVVWAETRAAVRRPEALDEAFRRIGIAFDPFDQPCAELAGDIWRDYRRRGGSRTYLVPDILVGAHAQVRAGRLVTRDRGFLKVCFKNLVVVDPTARRRGEKS